MDDTSDFGERLKTAILGVLQTEKRFVPNGEVGEVIVALLAVIMAPCDGMGDAVIRHLKCQEVAFALEEMIVALFAMDGEPVRPEHDARFQ